MELFARHFSRINRGFQFSLDKYSKENKIDEKLFFWFSYSFSLFLFVLGEIISIMQMVNIE